MTRGIFQRWVVAVALSAALVSTARTDDGGANGQMHNTTGGAELDDARADNENTEAPVDAGMEDADADAGDDADDAAPPAATQPARAVARKVGWIELSGMLREGPAPYAFFAGDPQSASLHDIVKALQHIADSPEYMGVVLYLDNPMLPVAHIDECHQALRSIRLSNKRVIAFAESYTLNAYLIACGADSIVLQQKGTLLLTGLALEEWYLAGLLEKIGGRADLVQIGEYKGASDPLMRTGPSRAWDSNIENVLDDIYAQIIDRISQYRGLSVPKVEEAFTRCWTMTDQELVDAGLIDMLSQRDLVEITEAAFGVDFHWDKSLGGQQQQRQQPQNPMDVLRMFMGAQAPRRPTRDSIALIHVVGPVTGGKSRPTGVFGGQSTGSRTITKALRAARDDENIKGVIVRIHSPGGSAIASEVIWQAIRQVAGEKPVFASIGPVAASGGYYIACAADKVFISPGSITGSIGVVGGKFVLGGLYEKIGLTVHRRTRGPVGDMFNSVEPFTDEQRELFTQAMQRTYEQFTDRVMTGRGDRLAPIHEVAQGLLFTGRQATGNGLGDILGGIESAIGAMAGQLELEPGTYDVVHMPPPMSLQEFFNEMFGRGRIETPSISNTTAGLLEAARHVMGPRAWSNAQAVLNGLTLLHHEPTLTLLPVVIDVH